MSLLISDFTPSLSISDYILSLGFQINKNGRNPYYLINYYSADDSFAGLISIHLYSGSESLVPFCGYILISPTSFIYNGTYFRDRRYDINTIQDIQTVLQNQIWGEGYHF